MCLPKRAGHDLRFRRSRRLLQRRPVEVRRGDEEVVGCVLTDERGYFVECELAKVHLASTEMRLDRAVLLERLDLTFELLDLGGHGHATSPPSRAAARAWRSG